MTKNGTEKFLIGIGIGLLIGVTTALLVAPQSGKETRKAIADKSKEVKEKAGKIVKDIKHKIKPSADSTHNL